MILREATAADAAALYDVMRASVASATLYSAAARAAWMPEATMPDWFADRIRRRWTILGEATNGVAAGFATLWSEGRALDLIYLRPAAQGSGLAGRLHDALVAEARRRGMSALTADASVYSRGFLLKRGWREIGTTETRRGDVAFHQSRVTLRLRD